MGISIVSVQGIEDLGCDVPPIGTSSPAMFRLCISVNKLSALVVLIMLSSYDR